MKGTDRKIDRLGRIVIPISYRRALDLQPNDAVTVSIKNGEIVISPVKYTCVICGTILEKRSKLRICRHCIITIKENENGE